MASSFGKMPTTLVRRLISPLGRSMGLVELILPQCFWGEFLRKLARRGLRGVKLVISDAHEGLKAAVAAASAPPGGAAASTSCAARWLTPIRTAAASVSAFIATAFAQGSADAAGKQ